MLLLFLILFTETYGEARLHLAKAEETSNLESDEDLGEVKKRKRKPKQNILPGEESDESFNTKPT